MNEIIDIFKNLNLFDLIFILILLYNVIQCFLEGFSLSLILFMKWVLSTIITIILVPKFQPIVSDYIESELNHIQWSTNSFLLVRLTHSAMIFD